MRVILSYVGYQSPINLFHYFLYCIICCMEYCIVLMAGWGYPPNVVCIRLTPNVGVLDPQLNLNKPGIHLIYKINYIILLVQCFGFCSILLQYGLHSLRSNYCLNNTLVDVPIHINVIQLHTSRLYSYESQHAIVIHSRPVDSLNACAEDRYFAVLNVSCMSLLFQGLFSCDGHGCLGSCLVQCLVVAQQLQRRGSCYIRPQLQMVFSKPGRPCNYAQRHYVLS